MMDTVYVFEISSKKNLYMFHFQLKGFIPILNCYIFVMERQGGFQSYLITFYETLKFYEYNPFGNAEKKRFI